MTQTPSFGVLLRRYRFESGLTQEALAARSGLSARGISDLERGARNAPHRETVRLLADALALDAPARAMLQAQARRPREVGILPANSAALPQFARISRPGLVGRARELDLLRGRLESALAGHGGVVLLAGEPGIGKTRLAEEVSAEAAGRQMHVFWGRCWENQGAPPFWPWIEVLREVVRHSEPLALRADLGPGASLIAELVPEVRRALPDLAAAPLLEPEEARFRLFDSVTATLRSFSRSHPVLLVLDDLHWADKPSLLLLQFLLEHVGSSRVLIVGTYRDNELDGHHALAEVLGSLRRDPSCESLPLTGLTVAAVGDLVNSCLDETVPTDRPTLARALWRATEGNPLFVREELRYLLEDDRWLHSQGARDATSSLLELGLPQGVRDVIRLRLSRLPESTKGLLDVAAVIGREFEASLLELSSGLEVSEIDAGLDDAQAASVIEELPGPLGRYRFSHALFREALYAELPARRRTRLHQQIAEALESEHARDLDSHLSELAYHYGEAQALVGSEKLVHYSLRAGEQALQSKAYEEGVSHFQRGLAAQAAQPMDGRQAALLFGLGRARAATAEIRLAHEVIASLTRAFDYYAKAGEVEQAVAVAECSVDSLPGQSVGAARLVARALALVPPDSHAAGRLLSRYARMVAIEEGDYEAAEAACNQALAIARREGDIQLEIQTLGNSAEADLNYLHWQEGLQKCLLAIDLAGRTDALQSDMLARLFAGIMLWLLGDISRAGTEASALLARADQLRDRRWSVSAFYIAGTVARFRGDWALAQDYSDQGLALSPYDCRLLWTRVALANDVGDLSLARSLIDKLLGVIDFKHPAPDLAQAASALVLATVADLALDAQELELAETAARAILSFPRATGQVLRVTWSSLAMMAVRRGDADSAALCYPALESASGTIIYQGMTADRLLGLLARTLGNHGTAAVHFEAARRFCRDAGSRPELAWTCHDYAALLFESSDPSAQNRAGELLEEALALSRELEMRPLEEQVLTRRTS